MTAAIAPQFRLPSATARPAATSRSSAWIIPAFLGGLIVFQIGLFLLGDTKLRLPLRVGVYGISLAALLLVRGRGTPHPAAKVVWLIMLVLGLGLLIPGGGIVAAIAQCTLYVATAAPLIWAGRLKIDRKTFRAALLIIWAFHTASAGLGVLQVKYPGRFDGAVSENYDDYFIGAMTITIADGTKLMRPKGLTDTAGGAGASGVSAAILAIGVLLTARNPLMQAAAVLSMIVGLFSIYLSNGRTNIVLVAVALIAASFVLLRRNDQPRLVLLAGVATIVTIVGTTLAFAIGGSATFDRFATLTAEPASEVVYKNRGTFLEGLLKEDIFKYPLGAGAGRWGMMNGYFGNPAAALWAEMQWQALLYDGGIQLILLYIWLLTSLLWNAWKIALNSPDRELSCWATAIFSFTLATVAASFVYPIYVKQAAVEVFLLNACLYAVSVNRRPGVAMQWEFARAAWHKKSFNVAAVAEKLDIENRGPGSGLGL